MNSHSIRTRLTLWYAALLLCLFSLFGFSMYLGFEHYLLLLLRKPLVARAQQIGDSLLFNMKKTGEAYVIHEITAGYAPELTGRFVRVTDLRKQIPLYVSGAPKPMNFDPATLPLPRNMNSFSERQLKIGEKTSLLVVALPFEAHGEHYLVEVGAPMTPIENALEGLMLIFVLGLPALVTLVGFGGYVLVDRSLRPIDGMIRTAEKITAVNLSKRIQETKTGDELERLSIALNRMIDRLDKSFQNTSQFSADASHELRTPLAVMRCGLEGHFRDQKLPLEVRETIGSVLTEAEHLSKIVEGLFAISRLDAGEIRMEKDQLDLTELVKTTAGQMDLLVEEKGLSLSYDLEPHIQAEGDEVRIKQVIVNLIDNAIKYTPKGGSIRLSVRKAKTTALFEISDTGIGIAPDKLAHIFERFYRVDKVNSRQQGGAGLGLSIVRSICTAHGGKVNVESKEGQGTSFKIELPFKHLESVPFLGISSS